MDFKKVSRISNLLSKSFAQDFFQLLVTYHDISASQAASRLDLHIKTAQDFLEELHNFDIVEKYEVLEKKRPYFRYTIKKLKFSIDVDLSALYPMDNIALQLEQKVRERKNAEAIFSTAEQQSLISSITIFVGQGRRRKERKINLTVSQGKFLYYLPFPTSPYLSIREILQKADINESHVAEILDIVNLLRDFKIIEFSN